MENKKLVEKSDISLIAQDYQTKINKVDNDVETLKAEIEPIKQDIIELIGINEVLEELL